MQKASFAPDETNKTENLAILVQRIADLKREIDGGSGVGGRNGAGGGGGGGVDRSGGR